MRAVSTGLEELRKFYAALVTAILAELVGPQGRIEAIEIEPELAVAARRNLRRRRNVVVPVDRSPSRRCLRPTSSTSTPARANRLASGWTRSSPAAG